MIEVGAHEDQAAGAALAFGGGDAGLGAPDLALEGFFSEALGFEQASRLVGRSVTSGESTALVGCFVYGVSTPMSRTV